MGRTASSWNPTPGWHGPIFVSFRGMKNVMLVRKSGRLNFIAFDLFLGKATIRNEPNSFDDGATYPAEPLTRNTVNRFFEVTGATRYRAEIEGERLYIRDLIKKNRRPVTDAGLVLPMPTHSSFRILAAQDGVSYSLPVIFGSWLDENRNARQSAPEAIPEPQF